MKNVTWIVLDDLKTNLLAALFVLILAANFTGIVELPVTLTESRTQVEEGVKDVRTTKVFVSKGETDLRVRVDEEEVGIKDYKRLLDRIDPNMSVSLMVERGSNLPYDTLILMLEFMKAKSGVVTKSVDR